VLLHELGHHRRFDLIWRWVFVILRAVFWFNPLVWFADRVMHEDQELACDEWVLTRTATIDARRYGNLLLQLCSSLPPSRITPPGHAAMAESASGMERRLRHLAQVRPRGWRAVFATSGLAGLSLLALGAPPSGAEATPEIEAEPAGA